MKGITYTQIAQFCVLIFAYTVPAIFISLQLTGQPVPQIGLGSTLADGAYLLEKLDALCWIWVSGIHHFGSRQHPQYGRLHRFSDDWHRRIAPRHHSFLSRCQRARRPHLGRLGAGFHCDSLHDGTASPPWRGSILSRHWSLNPVSISRLKSDRHGSKWEQTGLLASRIKTATVYSVLCRSRYQ